MEENNTNTRVSVISPLKKVVLVEEVKPLGKILKKLFNVIVGFSSIAGVVLTAYFANIANNIAKDNQSQDSVINQLRVIVDTLSSTNRNISRTQGDTYKLLEATLQSNKDFRLFNQPSVRLSLTGEFFSPPGGTVEENCYARVKYFIENQKALPANNFVGRVAFIKKKENDFECFYGFTTSLRGERIDLKNGSPVTFGSDVTAIDCVTADLFSGCFTVFEFSYDNYLNNSRVVDTLVFKHNRSYYQHYYFIDPVKDKKIKKSIIKWYRTGQLKFQSLS